MIVYSLVARQSLITENAVTRCTHCRGAAAAGAAAAAVAAAKAAL